MVFDDVQFLRRGWHHRDKIKTREGATWLTLSVKKGDYHQKINEVILGDVQEGWVDDNLNLIREHYQKAPCFSEYFPKIKEVYMAGYTKLVDINIAFLRMLFEIFEIRTKLVLASTLGAEGQNNERLINILKKVNGTHYLSGTGAKAYLDENVFAQEGIKVDWQKFTHPQYPQLHGDFIPNLSCLDILLNCGFESKNILQTCLQHP